MNASFWARGRLDAVLNGDLCTALMTVSQSNPIDQIKSIHDFIEPGDAVFYYAANGVTPRYTVVYWTNGAAFFFGGMENADQTNALIRGWGPQTPPSFGVVGANREIANDCYDFYREKVEGNSRFTPGMTVYFVGFSYGGAYATILNKEFDRHPINWNTKTWTYGMPRPGRLLLQSYCSPAFHTRCWLPEDPVRYIPPHSDEVPFLTWIASDDVVLAMNSQCQVGQGVGISSNAVVTLATGDPGNVDRPALSILGWVTGNNGFGNPQHSILEYRTRWYQASHNVGNLQPAPGDSTPDPPEDLTVQRIHQVRNAETPIVLQAVQNGTIPPTVLSVQPGSGAGPPVPGVVPERYRIRKVGRIWTVQFAGAIVAIGPGKRRAKSIRSRLNRTLTQLSM